LLGNRRNPAEAAALGREAIRAGADRFAAEMLPVIQGIRASGIATNDGIAEALNARGVRPARGGRWYGQTVKNVLRRAGQEPG
jgi:hypothetical protein